jgi:uncharacterized integral membrane protein
MRRLVLVLLVLVLVAFATAFTVLNPQQVELDLYFWRGALPLAVAVFAALALGVAIGIATLLGILLARHAELRRARKRLREAEQEILNLRNIPIRDEH